MSGAGNDEITTMMYCSATVDTGADHDRVFVLGMWDVITTGEGVDVVRLYGGACRQISDPVTTFAS